MKERSEGPLPSLAVALVLSLLSSCPATVGGSRSSSTARAGAGHGVVPEARAPQSLPSVPSPPSPDIAEALRMLERTRASIGRLERSVAGLQDRLSFAERRAAQGLAAQDQTHSDAFLQRSSEISGLLGSRRRGARQTSAPGAGQAAGPTTAQAQAAFNGTLSSVESLENYVAKVRRRLSHAERGVVNATMDAPPARRDVLRLENLTGANSRRLQNLTSMSANMNLTLTQDAQLLNRTLAKVRDLLNASAIMANSDGPGGTVEQAVNLLSSKVHAATQNGPTSLKGLLRRAATLEEEAGNFSAALNRKVRTFLVRRLRRGTVDVRRAMHRMSRAMPPLVAFPKDLPKRQPAFGLDLGLADQDEDSEG